MMRGAMRPALRKRRKTKPSSTVGAWLSRPVMEVLGL